MKTLLLAGLSLLFLQPFSFGQASNSRSPLPPLHEAFNEMAPTNRFPGMLLAAIYRFQSNKINYAGVGLVFRIDPQKEALATSESLFLDRRFTGAYAVRVARPNNATSLSFVDRIIKSSPDLMGRDLAIAALGTSPKVITNLPPSIVEDIVLFRPSRTIETQEKTTTRIYSYVTGKPVIIIGYGIRPSPEYLELSKRKENQGLQMNVRDDRPSVIVEFASKDGFGGTPFYDEHGRILFLRGVLEEEKAQGKRAREHFETTYGRKPQGLVILTSPLAFE